MMDMRTTTSGATVFIACWLVSAAGWANDISVTNVSGVNRARGSHWLVKFDIAWTNSWRCDLAGGGQMEPYNWDAAWIFVKYRTNTTGSSWSDWHHASLSTNAADHVPPAGSTITVGLSPTTNFPGYSGTPRTNGTGVFIYRNTNGSGLFTASNVCLRWNYVSDGVPDSVPAQLKVCAIEMVYVPAGAFYVGSTNGTESGRFHDGTSANMPFLVQTEGQILLTNQPNCLWATGAIGSPGVLPVAFPKGYAAFYGMKYEISQGQYVDFLNTLTTAQATSRWYAIAIPSSRYAITNVGGVYTSSAPHVACNYNNWADGAAFVDWAGLRPMTELEYEKACRGTNIPVKGEYAWGTTNITKATSVVNAGQANEAPLPANANCVIGYSGMAGPMRVGCLGIGFGTRTNTGAGYYGMMQLSGNIWEWPIKVSTAEGRAFTGIHGDGTLTVGGTANVTGWPGTYVGAGWRGGDWRYTDVATGELRVADRGRVDYVRTARADFFSWTWGRAVRTAP